ncbi:MAG: hypothetical protein ACLFU8_17355 [Anaerolineales bacterium]
MSKIRLIRDKEQLEGTLYFEILPGEYKGRCWNEGSLFVDEEVFAYLEPIIEEHAPHFDHYAFVEIPPETWYLIIADLRDLRADLAEAESIEELRGRVGFIFAGSERDFADHFEENRDSLRELLGELIVWLEDALETHATISLLGI